MIHTAPLKNEHLNRIQVQEAQPLACVELMKAGYVEQLHRAGPAYAALTDAGDVVMCAGLAFRHEDRALAWAVVSAHCEPHMLALTRLVRKVLDGCGARRIETTVACDFKAGHRWAHILGFTCETFRMKAFAPDGSDYSMYVRLRNG